MTDWIEETFHPHWRVRLEASRVLHEVKTEHQHLVIFENPTWGTVLMLDGVCQLTTSDEFVYHEMMAHVPLMALDKPKRVLVIGGGDGGVLREVLKHPSVDKATLCEIDRTVIDTALQHYPGIPGKVFDDKRADIVIADGLKYVAETDERFDAIIVDSSEPIGPSAVLHTREFFTDCKRCAEGRRHPRHAERPAASCSPSTCTEPRPCSPRCSSGWRPTCARSPAISAVRSRSIWRPTTSICSSSTPTTWPSARRSAASTACATGPRPATSVSFALPAYAQQVVEPAIEEAHDKGKKAKAYAELPKAKSEAKGKSKAKPKGKGKTATKGGLQKV